MSGWGRGLQLDADGNLVIAGNLIIAGGITIGGDVELGDALGDTVTINAGLTLFPQENDPVTPWACTKFTDPLITVKLPVMV